MNFPRVREPRSNLRLIRGKFPAVLSISRRHSAAKCKQTSRTFRRCSCPIYCDGTLNGKRIKKSLKTRNWRAQQLVQEMEAAGHEPNRVTIKVACDSFIRDAETRELKPATIAKYKLLFTRFQGLGDERRIAISQSG
jgi:integrase/recombinase XerD